MPEFPSFLRLLVCFLWSWFSSLAVHIQLWNLLNLPSKWLRSWPLLTSATVTTVVPATITCPLRFCTLLPLSSFQPSIYSNLLTIRSPVCSESCSLSSFCLEQKLKSPPQPARPRKSASSVTSSASCCSPCPPTPPPTSRFHPYSSLIWQAGPNSSAFVLISLPDISVC